MKKIYVCLVVLWISCSPVFGQACFSRICNGNFDSTSTVITTSGLVDSTFLYCWHTTASDKKMEVWGTGFNSVPSYSGNQFVELNATQAATMYQVVNLTAGSTVKIQFAHRARANAGQVDSVMVSVGPQSGPFTSLGTFGDGTAAWGYRTLNYVVPATGNYCVRFTPVYWALGNPAIGNFLDDVSVCEQMQSQGIHELGISEGLSVYPNPAASQATIRFSNESTENFSCSLFNYQGKLVRTLSDINGNEVKIEKQDLSAGLYFFRLESGKKTINGKITFIEN
ncbi:MAG: T9SS type A sorting domain-containing protein [Bacteroidia bacterium]